MNFSIRDLSPLPDESRDAANLNRDPGELTVKAQAADDDGGERFDRRYLSHSAAQTEQIAAEFAKEIKGGAVIAFIGGMGMGKTAFTRGFVKGMGNLSDVYSPTFAIVNDYGGEPQLYHFDMYRVNTWDDLYSTGFFDYMNESSVLLIEWSENIENALPEDAFFVEIRCGEKENDRKIRIYRGKDMDQ